MTHSSPPLSAPLAASLLPSWRQLLLFFAIAALLIGTNWQVIQAAGMEVGDFAANSLLVQDAKSFTLLKGNYSRVGFNHPGPAILYVLALGELVLHDWLHLVRAPVAGQLVAVAMYSAFWLVLMLSLLRRMSGALTPAALALAVFGVAAAYSEHAVFTGMWFPHLYFFPFAVLLLASARLVDGETDCLPALALAAGFLFNGHASFVAIMGIMLLTVLAANRRFAPAQRRILSGAFWSSNRRALWLFALIFGLFMLPLLIETVLHFPGPIRDYRAFSKSTKANTLVQAINYMAVYWGGKPFSLILAGAFGGALWIAARSLNDSLGRSLRALLLVSGGATLALVFYAKVGIDLLDHRYIGLFYCAVPALLVAAVALAWLRTATWQRKQAAAWALVMLCVLLTARRISQPAEYVGHYSQPAVADFHRGLSAIAHTGRLALDLDDSGPDAGLIWMDTLGLLAYDKRYHHDALCINRGWHISYTAALRCSDAEAARGPRIQLRVAKPVDPAPFVQGMGIAAFPVIQTTLAGQGELTVGARPELFKGQILGNGWSAVESTSVWSTGKRSVLWLLLKPDFTGTLVLDLDAFLPHPNSDQIVTLRVGDGAPVTVKFVPGQSRQSVRLPLRTGADALATVTLDIDHPTSPKMAGMSADWRLLGVALHGLTIEGQ